VGWWGGGGSCSLMVCSSASCESGQAHSQWHPPATQEARSEVQTLLITHAGNRQEARCGSLKLWIELTVHCASIDG